MSNGFFATINDQQITNNYIQSADISLTLCHEKKWVLESWSVIWVGERKYKWQCFELRKCHLHLVIDIVYSHINNAKGKPVNPELKIVNISPNK